MIARALIPLLLLVTFVGSGSAGGRKEWVKLTDCRYVDAPDNDGNRCLHFGRHDKNHD